MVYGVGARPNTYKISDIDRMSPKIKEKMNLGLKDIGYFTGSLGKAPLYYFHRKNYLKFFCVGDGDRENTTPSSMVFANFFYSSSISTAWIGLGIAQVHIF